MGRDKEAEQADKGQISTLLSVSHELSTVLVLRAYVLNLTSAAKAR